MAQILLLGDSLIEGIGDNQGGWCARLARQLPKQTTISGVGGRNTQDLLECLPCYDPSLFTLVILQIGINDSRYRPSLNGQEVPLKNFAKNLRTITDYFRAHDASVAVMGLTRVNENLTLPFKTDKYYRNSVIAEYDQILCDRDRFDADYIPAPPFGDNYGWLADGLHPNSHGHQLLLSAVVEYLRRYKEFSIMS